MCGMQTTTIGNKGKCIYMQKHICYFSKVFGYYSCVTILTIIYNLWMQYWKRIHAVGADTWINFTGLDPTKCLQALDSLN